MKLIGAVVALLVVTGITLGSCGSSVASHTARVTEELPTSAQLANKLLAVSDLPAGWEVLPANQSEEKPLIQGCKALDRINKGGRSVLASFMTAQGLLLGERISAYSNAVVRFRRGVAGLKGCEQSPIAIEEPDGISVVLTVGSLAVPQIGEESVGYSVASEVGSYPLSFDVCLIRQGKLIVTVEYGAVDGTVTQKSFLSYAREALSKVQGAVVTGV